MSSLGHFQPDGTYTVTTPRTPDAWPNFLFNLGFNRSVSQTGQGASAVARPVRREINRAMRLFYVKDHATGAVWNPNHVPLCSPLDSYACDHALGHTEIRSSAHGVASALTAFLPVEGERELWLWRVVNTTDRPLTLSLYAGLPMIAEKPMGTEVRLDAASGAVFAETFPSHHKYDDALPHLGRIPRPYWMSARRPDSWTGSERRFFGVGESLAYGQVPAMVLAPALDDVGCVWHAPLAVLAHVVTLAPGESFANAYQAGVETGLDAMRAHAASLTVSAVERDLAAVRARWDAVREVVRVETPDPAIDHFVNGWVKKQMIWQTECRRNAGAYPIRNVLQDAMGYSFLDPVAALAHAREILGLQRRDGSVDQWVMAHPSLPAHPFTRLHHNDGPVWLVLCTLAMVRQAGSENFLDEIAPYSDGGSGTVFEHLRRAIGSLAADRGRRGLCRMHDGDWTDPINGPGRKGEGETVWLTQGLLYVVREFRALRRVAADPALDRPLDALAAELEDAIGRAWNGEWFTYGYDDDGVAFGTPADAQGAIFLNAQTWALMSGCACGERGDKVRAAIDRVESACGPRISWPPYTEWNARVGRVSVKLAGTSENGAVYCHGVVFKAFADARLGDADRALDSLVKIMPTNPANPPEKNLQVPIFLPNSYFGIDGHHAFGESTLNHETSTASWFFMTIVEELLGLRATADGLVIRPLLPSGWTSCKVARTWGGSRYEVRIEGYRKGARPRVVCNGKELAGDLLPRGENAVFDVRVTYP